MFKTVLESAPMVIVNLILILWIDIASADLPEERMKTVLVPIFLEIIEKFDLLTIRLKVRPHIPVNRTDDFAA